MFKRILVHGLFCCAVFLLAACGPASPTASPTVAPQPTPWPTTAITVDPYQPIDPAECATLQRELAGALGVEVEQSTGPFEDYTIGERGTSCLLEAAGTGADFRSEQAVTGALQFMFENLGWEVDIRYTLRGTSGTATATAFGLRLENRLALVGIIWMPSDDAECPPDRPVDQCPLQPEQMLYYITVRVAQK